MCCFDNPGRSFHRGRGFIMSADNGIYMLKTLDGWRVKHLQCIDNIYWWPTCCEESDIIETNLDPEGDGCYHDICQNCETKDVEWERREKINPLVILDYFGDAKLLETEEDAFNEADFIYTDITKCGGGYVEYGIQKINGLEEIPFPTKS
jgi:hypothetical protein